MAEDQRRNVATVLLVLHHRDALSIVHHRYCVRLCINLDLQPVHAGVPLLVIGRIHLCWTSTSTTVNEGGYIDEAGATVHSPQSHQISCRSQVYT